MVKLVAMQSRRSCKEQSSPGVIWPGARDVWQNYSRASEWKPTVDKKPWKNKLLWLRDLTRQSRSKLQQQMFSKNTHFISAHCQDRTGRAVSVQFNPLTQYDACISSWTHWGWTQTKKCYKCIGKRRSNSFYDPFHC